MLKIAVPGCGRIGRTQAGTIARPGAGLLGFLIERRARPCCRPGGGK